MSKETVSENLKGLNSPAPAPAAASEGSSPLPDALRTAAGQAAVNAAVTAAVKGIFEQLGPLLQSIALTPEKLAEAEKMRRAPDPAKVAREMRERKMMQEEMAAVTAQIKEKQNACPHRYPTGQIALQTISNYPDRQPRFICPLCQAYISPRCWAIGAPDSENPRGVPYIAEASPAYAEAFKAMSAKGL